MIIGVSITMRTAFRDSTQEFSNTFHYDNGGATPSVAEAEKIIDQLVIHLKAMHATSVTFIRARLWSAGGTREQNTMIFQKPLLGQGSQLVGTNIDKERAYLLQWPAGKDRRGRPVRLKKWFHYMCAPSGGNLAASVLDNTAGLSDAERTVLQNHAAKFQPLFVDLIGYQLVSKSGRGVQGDVRAHRYFEHHQLGDQWRT